MKATGSARAWAGWPSERVRLLEAAIASVSAVGYEATSIEMIVRGAHSSRDAFDRTFSDKDDCCRAAFEDVCDHFDRYMLPIYLRSSSPPTKIVVAVNAATDYCLEYERRVAFGLQVGSRYRGRPRVEESMRFHLEQVDSLRSSLSGADRQTPAFAPDLCLGFVLGLLVRLGAAGRICDLRRAVPSLLHSILGVYLGPAAAESFLRDHEASRQKLDSR